MWGERCGVRDVGRDPSHLHHVLDRQHGVQLEHEEPIRALGQLQRILEGINSGRLAPVIDSVFDAEDVAKAHQYIHDGKNIGKVLLRFK